MINSQSSSPTSRRREENALGLLRLLLAALVVSTHSRLLGGFTAEPLVRWTNSLSLGTIAVAAFFTLSGLLVTSSYLRLRSLPRFLWHRILRIAPAFWACLIVTAFIITPLAWILHPAPRPPAHELVSPAMDYVGRNFISPRSIIGVPPFPTSVPWPSDWNGSLWTIFYEGACYLIIATFGVLGLLNRRSVGFTLLICLPLLHGAWSLYPDFFPTRTSRLFDTPGKLLTLHFLVGAALAVLPSHFHAMLRKLPFSLILIALLAASWFSPWHGWLSPFFMPGLILAFGSSETLAWCDRRLRGDYSYGLYLYHYPLGQLLAAGGLHQLGLLTYTLGTLITGLVAAWLSWRLIEAPALGFKNLGLRRSSAIPG